MKAPDFVSRMGTVWDVMAKETLMFPGIDSAAVSVGLVTGPRQNESPLIRVLKEFLYTRPDTMLVSCRENEQIDYVQLNMDRDEFGHAFSNHRSMSGDFKDAEWARENLARWERNSVGTQLCAIVLWDSDVSKHRILFLRDFLSQVITSKEKDTFDGIRRDIARRTGTRSSAPNFYDKITKHDTDTTSGNRNDYCLYTKNCTEWPDKFDHKTHGRKVLMLQLDPNVETKPLKKNSIDKLNSYTIVPGFKHNSNFFLVTSLAFDMTATATKDTNDFSSGMAKVIHNMNATDPQKGRFRVTVPVHNTEFPLVGADTIAPPAQLPDKMRINPLYINDEQRNTMSRAARAKLTARHRQKMLHLDPLKDNEDSLEQEHYRMCRLWRFLQSDSDRDAALSLARAIYRRILSIRARQAINDRLVRERALNFTER